MIDQGLYEKLMRRAKALPNGCVEYTGTRNSQGYGQLYHGGRTRPTHRLMYEAVKGHIPKGMMVLHSCDHPPCMNAGHLSAGTATDNIRQAVARGRHSWAEKTHCKHGHEFAGDNLYICKEGRRHCKTCTRIKTRMRSGWPEDLARSTPACKLGYVPPNLKRVAPETGRKPKSEYCGKGHALTGANRYVNTRGYVNCNQCQRDARTRYAKRITAQQMTPVDGGAES